MMNFKVTLSFDLTASDAGIPGLDEISGEIYISLERARIQAEEQKVPFVEELARLLVHARQRLDAACRHPVFRLSGHSESGGVIAKFSRRLGVHDTTINKIVNRTES